MHLWCSLSKHNVYDYMYQCSQQACSTQSCSVNFVGIEALPTAVLLHAVIQLVQSAKRLSSGLLLVAHVCTTKVHCTS
jgi:hypothetical protein